jgi:hypothetical protein
VVIIFAIYLSRQRWVLFLCVDRSLAAARAVLGSGWINYHLRMGAREDLAVAFFDDCVVVLCLNVPSVSLEGVPFETASPHVAKTKVSATPICCQ